MIIKINHTEIIRDLIKKKIYSRNSKIYVSEENKKLFGFILFSVVKSSPIYILENFGRIDNIYIKSEYHGRGISSKFKDVAFKWFKKKGVNRFQLFVFQDNTRAINIYKKWGFTNRLIEMRMSI